MAEEKELKQAKEVYKTLCTRLDEHNWRYEKDEENLKIHCGAQGDDLPMEIYIEVDKKRQLVSLLSPMPFTVPENRRSGIAVAVSMANYGMVDGSFDFDYLTGRLLFRMTTSYRESIIGKELFTYMLMCSCITIDRYNDKFLVVAKQDMTVEQILELVQ